MEYTVLLNTTDNRREIESEEQTRFIISIVEALDIPFEWDSNEKFGVLDRIRLRKALAQYNVSVTDDLDGGVKIYLDREKIAEWYPVTWCLKEDLTQIDRKKRLFIEMKCRFSSMFEQEANADNV